ncbi:MAG TPA: hypothetical protein VFG91_00080 [Woeseiaceae bacterium]|nr:hypothetical protein [Woeseiaceae bacterium]
MNGADPAVRGHESGDVSFRGVFLTGAALLGVLALLAAILWYVSRATLEGVPAPAPFPAVSVTLAPGESPVLQVTPESDLARLRAREAALLHGYGWVDRERGIARIPIERAMEILAAGGEPASGTEPDR